MMGGTLWDTETCYGYVAAIVSILAFGSFATPIKCKATRSVSVDPLVLQTYKVVVCFLTSWIVLCFGVKFSFTPYGFVSGILMVPGGAGGYYGVRNAGLAVSQGIWSSLKVLVAFAWGLFIFREPVRSNAGTALAVGLMLVGLVGMSYFASRRDEPNDLASVPSVTHSVHEPLLYPEEGDTDDDEENNDARDYSSGTGGNEYVGSRHSLFRLSPRTLGIIGAVVDGLYGGSVLVPMHFATKQSADFQGLGYLISFSIGCMTIVTAVWLGRWAMYAMQEKSWTLGYNRLPGFHLKAIGLYASVAGLVWSVGNVSSIVSVAKLGQGLGYSLVQSQLIVAGIWAVFFYREIRGRKRIIHWFGFASITLLSILLLTRQHQPVPTLK